MPISFRHMVDKAFEDKSIEDVLQAPPSALQGVSPGDSQHLKQAFGIDTVREMAQNRFFHYALAVKAAAGRPSFDPGPPDAWHELFEQAPLDQYVNHASNRFRLAFGPVYYRGRLDRTARVLVVGQDPGTDELLGQRAFVGQSGQRVQRVLNKIGITRSYIILNTFLFGIFGQFDNEMQTIASEPAIEGWRNQAFEKAKSDNELEAVIAFGAAARFAVDHWPGVADLPVFELVHPAAPDNVVLPDWNKDLQNLISQIAADDDGQPDPTPYGAPFGPTDAADIPRFDLPFGIPPWHGTGGRTRSVLDGNDRLVWDAGS